VSHLGTAREFAQNPQLSAFILWGAHDGVCLFFVVSGFVIPFALFNGQFAWGAFPRYRALYSNEDWLRTPMDTMRKPLLRQNARSRHGSEPDAQAFLKFKAAAGIAEATIATIFRSRGDR